MPQNLNRYHKPLSLFSKLAPRLHVLSFIFHSRFLLSTRSFDTTLNRHTARTCKQHVALLHSIATTDKWVSSSYLAGAYQWLLAANSSLSLFFLAHFPSPTKLLHPTTHYICTTYIYTFMLIFPTINTLKKHCKESYCKEHLIDT